MVEGLSKWEQHGSGIKAIEDEVTPGFITRNI